MSELVSEADAHVARPLDDVITAALAAAADAVNAAARALEVVAEARAIVDRHTDVEAYMAGRAPDVVVTGDPIAIPATCEVFWQRRDDRVLTCTRRWDHADPAVGGRPEHKDPSGELWTDAEMAADVDADDEPVVDREDRWIGTGEPVVEAPPVSVEGAMPADHCGKHRDHRPDCRACITALEAQDTWRSVTANRVAAARAEVAAEIAAGQKPLPPGRQAFRDAKAGFDAKRKPASDDQKTAITVILNKRGIVSRPAVLAAIGEILGRDVSSRNDMTSADATRVMDHLNAIPLPPDPALPEVDHQRPVDPDDGPPARSVEHPVDDAPPRACGRCDHMHLGECDQEVLEDEDTDDPVVMPCGCPEWTEYGAAHLPVDDEPDKAAESNVQSEHVDTANPPVGSDDGPAADAADGPDDDMPAIDRVLAGIDDDADEFDRTRPGWRDYDTGGTYAMTTTGGTDEPIF